MSRDSGAETGFSGHLFDAHLHYEGTDTPYVSAPEVLGLLDRNGIGGALLSGVPDANTILLANLAPRRIVPFARPFDSWKDKWKWQADPGVEGRVAAKLATDSYAGIGEFNLKPRHVALPGVEAVARLAKRHDIFLHVEVNQAGLADLMERYAGVHVLWAHAGLGCGAGTVGQLTERFPTLYVELAQRFDLAPRGTLTDGWRAVLVRYHDRFLVGTGASERRIARKMVHRWRRPANLFTSLTHPRAAWNQARWSTVDDSVRATRNWLGQLPADVADAVAFGNAERLFGTT